MRGPSPTIRTRHGSKLTILAVVVGLSLSAIVSLPAVEAATPGKLSSISIQPEDPLAGATTNYRVTFKAAGGLPGTGGIVLDFGRFSPNGVDVRGVSPTLVAKAGCTTGTFGVIRDGSTVAIGRRDGTACAPGTTMSFTLAGIKNPSAPGTYSITTVGAFTTRSASNAVIDQNPATPAITLAIVSTGGHLTNLQVSPGDNRAGAVTTYAVAFDVQNPLPPNSKIAINFGNIFRDRADLSRLPATVNVVGCPGPFAVSTADSVVTLQGGTSGCGGRLSFALPGVRNPLYFGRPFEVGPADVLTMLADNRILDSYDEPVSPASFMLSLSPLTDVTFIPESAAPGAITTYELSFTSLNEFQVGPERGGAELTVGFNFAPGGFDLTRVTSVVGPMGCGQMPTGQIHVSGSTEAFAEFSGGSSCPAGRMTFRIAGVKNPEVVGRQTLKDTAFLTIGSFDFFASDALPGTQFGAPGPLPTIVVDIGGPAPPSTSSTTSTTASTATSSSSASGSSTPATTAPPTAAPAPSRDPTPPALAISSSSSASSTSGSPVQAGEPVRLTLRPQTVSVTLGTPQLFEAALTDAAGSPLPTAGVVLTMTNGTCTGFVCMATAPGAHVVTATAGDLVGNAVLTVEPAGSKGSPGTPFWALVGVLALVALLAPRGGRRA